MDTSASALYWESSYVAIVDDLEINRRFLRNLSRNLGCIGRVKTFGCAQKALENFKEDAPDLIVTDFSMPGMDASVFLDSLRTVPGLEETPVIVVSATGAENRRKALLCGATDFLTTPFDVFEFQVRIRNLLKLALHQKFLRARSLSLHHELSEARLLSSKRIRDQEEKFNSVIDCVPALIFAVTDRAECIFSNKYCFEFFGPEPDNLEKFIKRLMRIHEQQPQGAIEIAASNGTGKTLTFLIMRRYVPLKDDSNAFTIFTGIDISSLKLTQESLRVAKCQAETANSAKGTFLANISHEIRTPLNAIIGFADIMDAGTFGTIEQERYREYVKDILHSSKHLLKIINEILDLSQIERGEQPIAFINFRLSECVSSAARMLDKELRAKNNILEFNIAHDCILRSDPQRLTQVLLNMITNANKHSEGGTISISVRDSGYSSVTISVEDHGIGMTEREIRIAMSDFGRVTNPHIASLNEGIGLGLPISNRLMRLLGGELSIWSEKGIGTRIDLIFPSSTIIKRELLDQEALAEMAGP